MFNEDEILAFIYDEYVNIEMPKVIKNPYVIARCLGQTNSKLDQSAVYIIHLQKQELLNSTFAFLKLSTFWVWTQYQNNRYIIIINETSTQDLQKIFTFFWNRKIHKVLVVTQQKSNDLQLHTSNPFHKENNCGTFVNVIRSQNCNDNVSFDFSKTYTDINNCSITFVAVTLANSSTKRFVLNFFKELAKQVNGKFTEKYTSDTNELINTLMQPTIAITTSAANPSKFDLSNIAFRNKAIVVVNGGDVISPIKTLFVIFKIEVWIMIFVSIGLTALALWLILSFDKKRFTVSKLGKCVLDVFLATIWGYFVSIPKNIKPRYIIICYLVYQLHIQTGFTSNLVTILTTPQYKPGIQNLEELIISNLSIITFAGAEALFFQRVERSNNTYSKIRNQIRYMKVPAIIRANLLNYKNCATLELEIEFNSVQFAVGEKFHVNRIDTDLVIGTVRTYYAMGPGHYFLHTLNSFMRNMEESATIWGYFVSVSKNINARYVIICYLVYQIHIQTGFTSNLVTVLTTPQYQPGIQNLEELISSNLSIIGFTTTKELYFRRNENSSSIYNKIKNQMLYTNTSQFERIDLLKSSNCAILMLELEFNSVESTVGEKFRVNRINTDLVTGTVRTYYAMGNGHYFLHTLNSFMSNMEESVAAYQNINLDVCVSKCLNKMFNEDETLAFIYDEYVDIEIPNIIKNPYVIARCLGQTKSKLDQSAAYIIHLQKQESLNSTFAFLKLSTFWVRTQYQISRYLIIINETNTQDLQKIFTFFWNLKIHKVLVLTQQKSNYQTSVQIHKSNPFYEENNCGTLVNVIRSQNCDDNVFFDFSKKYIDIKDCSITFLTTTLANSTTKTFIVNFFTELAKQVNGKFILKYALDRSEIINILMQPTIAISMSSNNPSAFDLSNIAFRNKAIVVVNGGDIISPIKYLFIIFKIEVWIMIFVSIVLTALALWLILSFDKKRFTVSKLGKCVLEVFLATIWGYFVSIPKNIKPRYIIICYLVYQLHIQTGFTSNLVTVLTTPQYKPGIQNLEELITSNLSIIAFTRSEELFFQRVERSNSSYTKVKNQIRYINTSAIERANLLNYKNCAILELELEFNSVEFTVGEKFHVNRIDIDLVTGIVRTYYVMGSGHYFLKTLNTFMRNMEESGITQKNIAKMYDDYKVKPRFKNLVSLNLKHLLCAFAFLLFGLTIASVVFVVEIVTSYY
ncbi:hypothetical protein RN001_011679 [Aquatica leii]|uniref:Ionotropic glutamate receptor C-terminal domain-containing protein n=1 Tax=Aquatica leii TaxID=1421715 RepID=A0AAN7PT90_9COLE|nr:hypothetical protein RN001_011679 [Aquatica leii]